MLRKLEEKFDDVCRWAYAKVDVWVTKTFFDK